MSEYGGKVTSGFTKYPSKRDNFLDKTASKWLQGKRMDDAVWPYWRIHEKLYDLTSFASQHPGGRFWIECSQGLDITEVFESFHLRDSSDQLLASYYVQDAKSKRVSPFTFHENGFYRTLKRKVKPILQKSDNEETWKYKRIQDSLFVTFLFLFCCGGLWKSQLSAVASGIFLAFSTMASHNYFHQRDNWRMYIFDFGLFGSSDWRVTHAISHHSFPNTIYDFEVSFAEPFIKLIPLPKSWMSRHFIAVAFPIVLAGTAVIWVSRIIRFISGTERIQWTHSIVGIQLITLIFMTQDLYMGFRLWLIIHFTSGLVFSFLGFISAHWNTETFFEEDEPPSSRDWGIHQIAATKDVAGFSDSLLLTAITFGNHTLHHLFPTVDHAKLPLLMPVFLETCREFNIEFHVTPWYRHFLGLFKQASRTKPRPLASSSYRNIEYMKNK